jgi:hypothetical protein
MHELLELTPELIKVALKILGKLNNCIDLGCRDLR